MTNCKGPSFVEQVSHLSPRKFAVMMRWLNEAKAQKIYDSWTMWARREQLPPAWYWSVWLMLAGRGFGKTRAGAEWVHDVAQEKGVRIALVGATEDEVRRVMIEGSSGILACSPIGGRPEWEPSKGVLTWPNGAKAFVYSGANADGLRGPEHHYAWCDEIAKWAHADAAWDNLRMGMRCGRRPQIVVTTTPRNKKILKRILAMPGVAVTRGRTRDNAHLDPGQEASDRRTAVLLSIPKWPTTSGRSLPSWCMKRRTACCPTNIGAPDVNPTAIRLSRRR